MKVTNCPYCGQGGLSGSVKYPTTLRERSSGLRDNGFHSSRCPKWPDGDFPVPPVPEPGAIEIPPAEIESVESKPVAPNGGEASRRAGAEPNGNGRLDAAAQLLDLLARPTVDESQVRTIVAEAIAEIELPEAKRFDIHVGDAPSVEIGSAHHLLPRLVSYAANRLNTMLVGPAGSGKTTAGAQVAEALHLPYYEIAMGPATSQWDLIGYLSPDGRYVPGMLRQAFEQGGVCFLDEIDNSNPKVLTAVNALIANGHFRFPDGERVAKSSDFILICSANTYGRGADRLYVGRQQLDAATLDRFAVIDWDYDEAAEIDWAGRDQQEWTRWVQKCRHQVMKLGLRVVISPRASINGAKLLRAGRPRDEIEAAVVWKGASRDDVAKIRAGL